MSKERAKRAREKNRLPAVFVIKIATFKCMKACVLKKRFLRTAHTGRLRSAVENNLNTAYQGGGGVHPELILSNQKVPVYYVRVE